MIVALTPNPALDRAYEPPGCSSWTTNRGCGRC